MYVQVVCMVKKHTTLNIDADVLRKAKELQLNISSEVEDFLKKRVVPKKSDLPEDNLVSVCSLCRKEINEGYRCLERDLVLCSDCQKDFNMSKCPHDQFGEHMHIKW